MCWCPAAHYRWKRDKKGPNPIPCSAQRCSWLLHKATRAALSQQMWDRSTGSAQHHLSAPRVPPQPQLVFPAMEFPVEQGRCLRVLSVPAQKQMRCWPWQHSCTTWLWKGISTGRGEEQLLPQVTQPMGLQWGSTPRGDQSEPCRADPIRFLGAAPPPTDTTCRFHQWTAPEQLRANSRPKAPAPQKSGQWDKN